MEIECSDRLFSVKFLTSSNLKEEESEGRSTRGGAHHAMWRRFSSGLRALVRFVVNSASFFGYSCARRSQHCAEGDRLPPKRQWAGSISHLRSREQLGQVKKKGRKRKKKSSLDRFVSFSATQIFCVVQYIVQGLTCSLCF